MWNMQCETRNVKHALKWGILTERQDCEMMLKKRDFTPESGNVDTYAYNKLKN